MRMHVAVGDRARAVRVFHACVATLERELGVQPSVATAQAYEALMTSALPSPGGPLLPDRITGPVLVGRTGEWSRLTSVWRDAGQGRAQLVLVTGEPGVGKTRLVEELAEWCAHRGALVARARSYAAEGALAYGMVTAWLRTEGLEPALPRRRGDPGAHGLGRPDA